MTKCLPNENRLELWLVAFLLSGSRCARLLDVVETEAAVLGVGGGPAALHGVGVDVDDERLRVT